MLTAVSYTFAASSISLTLDRPHPSTVIAKPRTWSASPPGRPKYVFHDGMEATVSIFTEDGKTRATFPNHLWSKRSVERALEASGFEKISWAPLAADGAPPDPEESYMEIVGVFTARLA